MARKTRTTNIIEVKNLSKKYDNFLAVDNISFDVKKGEVFAFLGPNGAGKSTTIKMLTTLLAPTSGEMKVGGLSPVNDQDKVRHMFGIVFQDPSLDDDLTAYENMQYHAVLYSVSREIREARIEELLKYVELWDRKDSLVKTFSGGMRRRLEIARGLLHHPQIFFLDEPTLGLDPQTRNHIWEYILKLNQSEGVTVFFTTHYISEAEKVAQKVAIIDHGKIIAQGSPKELMEQTHTTNLEDAYLSITGTAIREEEASGAEQMRMHRRIWHR